MKIGLALAGGGLKGIAHIGALKALEEMGIKPEFISGTSSGSVMAAMYAMGFTIDEMIKIIRERYSKLTNIEKMPIITAAGNYLVHRELKMEGLTSGEKIENLVNMIANKKGIYNISDVKTNLAVATVDTISTKECIFLSKKFDLKDDDIDYIYDIPIGKAIRASMSFPGIFTTCNFDKYNFIDGGTKDNLPVKVLKDMGAEKVIALSFRLDDYTPSNNMLSVLLRTVDIFSQKDVLAAQKMADLAIEIDASGTSLLSIDDMDKCLNVGYETIMQNKENILNILK